jgi:WD40 repeat protein
MNLKHIRQIIFGQDIFISHRWTESSKQYALKLTEELEKRGLDCFIDYNEIHAGDSIPKLIQLAIKRSKMFLLVTHTDVKDSTWIPQEIKLATNDPNRKIIPLNIGGMINQLDLKSPDWSALNDRDRIEESLEAFDKATPSPEVLRKIDRAFTERRNKSKATNALFTLAVFVLLATFVPAGYALYVRRQAEIETKNLQAQAQKALADAKAADLAKNIALSELKTAQDERKSALTERDQFRGEKEIAENERNQAKSEALKQGEIAADKTREAEAATAKAAAENKKANRATERAAESEKREIISKSNLASNYYAIGQTQKTSNPTEAMVWMQKAIKTLPDDDGRLESYVLSTRNLMRTMPKLVIRPSGGLHYGTAFSLSPSEDKAVTLSAAGKITVWNLKTGESFPTPLNACNCTVIGNAFFSPDGQQAAVLTEEIITVNGKYRPVSRIRIWNAETGVETEESRDAKYVLKDNEHRPPTFTPDGKGLIFVYQGFNVGDRIEVLNLASGEFSTVAESVKIELPRGFSTKWDAPYGNFLFPIGESLNSNWIITYKVDGKNKIAEVRNLHTGELALSLPPVRDLQFIDFMGNSGRVTMVYRESEESPRMIQTWDISKRAPLAPPARFAFEQFGKYSDYVIGGATADGEYLLVTTGGPRIDKWDVETQKSGWGTEYWGSKEDFSIQDITNGKPYNLYLANASLSNRQFIQIIAGIRPVKQLEPLSKDETIIVLKKQPLYIRISNDSFSIYDTFEPSVPQKADSSKVLSTNSQYKLDLTQDECLFYAAETPDKKAILGFYQEKCYRDGNIKMQLWDVSTKRKLWNPDGIDLGRPAVNDERHLANSSNYNIKVAFNAKGDKFVVLVKGYDNNFVTAWNTTTGAPSPGFMTIKNDVRDIVFSRDNSQLVTVEYDNYFNYRIERRNASTGALIAEELPLYLNEITDGLVRGLTKNGEQAVLLPYWGKMYNAGEIVILDTNQGGKTTFSFLKNNNAILAIAALLGAENISLADNRVLVYLDTLQTNPLLISSDGGMFINRNNESKHLLSPSGISLRMDDEIKLLEGGKVILLNDRGDRAVHLWNSETGQSLVSLARNESTTFIDWQKAPSNPGFFTITRNGKIHSLYINASSKGVKPFWIDEIDYALSGLEIINDSIIKPIPHEKYLVKRREYIKKLQTASENGDYEAEFILKIWNP